MMENKTESATASVSLFTVVLNVMINTSTPGISNSSNESSLVEDKEGESNAISAEFSMRIVYLCSGTIGILGNF